MADTTWTPELTAAMRRFKGNLTRAQNRKDWRAVIKVADELNLFFASKGLPLPDDWARWENAREEAEFELRRAAICPW